MASNAVSSSAISRVLGYQLTTGNFINTTPNLPARIAILGEANAANQTDLDLTPVSVTSAQQAGELYGFGSPIYNVMRILRPVSGGGVGAVETVVYPQAEAGSAESQVNTITVTGTATANATHYVKVAGRTSLDGETYAVLVKDGDDVATVAGKIADAVNGVLGCPFSAVAAAGVVTFTSKWKGETAASLVLEMFTDSVPAGMTYTFGVTNDAVGVPSVTTALNLFGNEWNNIVLNTYGTDDDVMDALEAYNGIPSATDPTGRYAGITFKPFVALAGNVSPTGLPAEVIGRRTQVTNVICPAPNSSGHAMEAAANVARLLGVQMNDNPELAIAGQSYPDMPTAATIGDFANYDDRNLMAKSGVSTVDLVNGAYQVQELVTTYHPVGELNPQFRYVRSLVQDFNVKFGYRLLEEIYVQDHVIANDEDTIKVGKFVKPMTWKSVLGNYFDDLVERGIIVDADFSKDSLIVNLSTTNPDRLETFFKYKRSGFARVGATTVEAGFNFGV